MANDAAHQRAVLFGGFTTPGLAVWRPTRGFLRGELDSEVAGE
jgi:hypothetical protein